MFVHCMRFLTPGLRDDALSGASAEGTFTKCTRDLKTHPGGFLLFCERQGKSASMGRGGGNLEITSVFNLLQINMFL